jgi:Na+/H+ antiporter NhaA
VKPELEKQVDKLRGPFSSFIQAQTTASAFLLLALIAALLIANSGYAHELTAIRHLSLRIGVGEHSFEWTLLHLVND